MTTNTETETISLDSFARLVILQCRQRGIDPNLDHLERWLAARWSRVVEEMDVEKWSRLYLEDRRRKAKSLR